VWVEIVAGDAVGLGLAVSTPEATRAHDLLPRLSIVARLVALLPVCGLGRLARHDLDLGHGHDLARRSGRVSYNSSASETQLNYSRRAGTLHPELGVPHHERPYVIAETVGREMALRVSDCARREDGDSDSGGRMQLQ
jgi:hypothetical protein